MTTQTEATKKPSTLGKYREIVIAVGFFLLFDLGVLVLNFYTSFQIADDANAINLAGRQRMLSQRTTKAVFALDTNFNNAQAREADAKELSNALALFDKSLAGFESGGKVPGGSGKIVQLNAVSGVASQLTLKNTRSVWQPLFTLGNAATNMAATQVQVAEAAAYARTNNLRLLELMNELTTQLEAEAAGRASFLRMVQTVGIVLALLNFVFILFKFIKRLRTSDAATDKVNEENSNILASVREGLFLLNRDKTLGTQISKSVATLFNRPIASGDNFLKVLGPMVDKQTLSDAEEYLELLFSPKVKEQLVMGINPLSEVQIQFDNKLGNRVSRYVNFSFNRVLGTLGVNHLLVTVQDITEQMELKKTLANERNRSQKEFSMLIKAFEVDSGTLRDFVNRADASLLEINDLLRGLGELNAPSVDPIGQSMRLLHGFKGDAASLGMDVLAQLAHQLESELQGVRNNPASKGESLLRLLAPLDDLLKKVSAFKALTQLQSNTETSQAASAPSVVPSPQARQESPALASHATAMPLANSSVFNDLAQHVANDLGKAVRVETQLGMLQTIATASKNLIHDMLVQLIRNAVAHGIETAGERQLLGKPSQGVIAANLTVDPSDANAAVLTVRDDGAGLDVDKLRKRLIALKWFTPEVVATLNDKQILAQLFKPGFSTVTAGPADQQHAGRGVGLDLVHANSQRLGARMSLGTEVGRYTEFSFKFPLVRAAQ